jgi:hypothetical protein
MNLSVYKNLYEILYLDKLAIYKYITEINTDGTTGITLNTTPGLSNINCRISFMPSWGDNPETSNEDKNPTSQQVKIFCSPNIAIAKGDKLVATRTVDAVVTTYEGIANNPQMFETHQEILFSNEGVG